MKRFAPISLLLLPSASKVNTPSSRPVRVSLLMPAASFSTSACGMQGIAAAYFPNTIQQFLALGPGLTRRSVKEQFSMKKSAPANRLLGRASLAGPPSPPGADPGRRRATSNGRNYGDSDFRVLEALLHKGPLPVNTWVRRSGSHRDRSAWPLIVWSSGGWFRARARPRTAGCVRWN